MTDDILDRVDQTLSGVTDGPWEVVVETYSSDGGDYEAAYIPGVVEEGASGYDVEPYGPLTVPVAEFIAASRTLMPELADALRAARTENEQLRAQVEGAEVGASNAQVLLAKAADDYDALVTENERLQQFVTIVECFIAERANFITAIKNCAPDNTTDYWRWQGHAGARRVLLEQLPPDIAERIAKKAGITR